MNFDFALSTRALVLVAIGVVSLTVIVVILSIVVFTHHLISERQRRRNREQFEGAANLLAPFLVSPEAVLSSAIPGARHKFGDRAVSLVLRRARFDLKGEVATRISEQLSEMGAIDHLIAEARSRRDWKRISGVRGLGECGGEAARKILIDSSMNDPVGDVRRAAREGLLADHTPEATKAAIDSFLQDIPRRAGWRRSFYARLATVASAELLDLIQSKRLSAEEAKLALEALGDAGAKPALKLAVAESMSPEAELRATAVRVVGKLGGATELPLVIKALGDDAWFVRAAAARALEWMIGTRALQVREASVEQAACVQLNERLNDTSWWVRANAARALSRAGERGLDMLLHTGEGKDPYARDAALAALAMAELNASQQSRLRIILRRAEADHQQRINGSASVVPQPIGSTVS